MSTHLGKTSFLDLPDVNGSEIVISGTGTTNQISTSQAAGTGNLVISLASNPIIPGTAAMRLPVGTTAQRSGSPGAGDFRFNSTLGADEIYNGTAWVSSGRVLQMASSTIVSSSYTAAQITPGSTIPTVASGAQIWTASFTPLSASSTILIIGSFYVSHGNAGRVFTSSLYAGSTNLGTSLTTVPAAAAAGNTSFVVAYQPGSTAAITFSLRTGTNGAGVMYVNRLSNATLGSQSSDIQILEII